MNTSPLVSIALPAFKEKYLIEAINSILNQTYDNFELIIINDCSPENIYGIVEKYDDKRIRYHQNPTNIGAISLVKQWNHCLSYANGSLFVLASDDDIYSQDFLVSLVDLTKKYPNVDIFHTRIDIIDSEGRSIEYSCSAPEWESCLDFMWHKMKGFRQQFIPEFMFRTEALRNIGGFIDFPSATGSDYATCFKIAKDNGVGYCSHPLLKWRKSGINISSGTDHAFKKLTAAIPFTDWLFDFASTVQENIQLPSLREQVSQEIANYKERLLTNIIMQNKILTNLVLLIKNKIENKYVIPRRIIIKGIVKKIIFT